MRRMSTVSGRKQRGAKCTSSSPFLLGFLKSFSDKRTPALTSPSDCGHFILLASSKRRARHRGVQRVPFDVLARDFTWAGERGVCEFRARDLCDQEGAPLRKLAAAAAAADLIAQNLELPFLYAVVMRLDVSQVAVVPQEKPALFRDRVP